MNWTVAGLGPRLVALVGLALLITLALAWGFDNSDPALPWRVPQSTPKWGYADVGNQRVSIAEFESPGLYVVQVVTEPFAEAGSGGSLQSRATIPDATKGEFLVTAVYAGWPLNALSRSFALDQRNHHFRNTWVYGDLGTHLVFACHVEWLGFIADTAIFSVALAVPLVLGSKIMAWIRRHRIACVQCGYDRQGLAVDAACPECGDRCEDAAKAA